MVWVLTFGPMFHACAYIMLGLLISCSNWPKCEYSHHTQLCSLSGGLILRNWMLASRVILSCQEIQSRISHFDQPNQPSATSPLFSTNLHFEHFDKQFKVDLLLTLLSKCSKWRLSKKRGLVSDGWTERHRSRCAIFSATCNYGMFDLYFKMAW
jgi:hypothetical protein